VLAPCGSGLVRAKEWTDAEKSDAEKTPENDVRNYEAGRAAEH